MNWLFTWFFQKTYNLGKIFGYATGNCAATQPTEGQACNDNCACVTGSICTNNILCPKCGKICMATDVYNRLVCLEKIKWV